MPCAQKAESLRRNVGCATPTSLASGFSVYATLCDVLMIAIDLVAGPHDIARIDE